MPRIGFCAVSSDSVFNDEKNRPNATINSPGSWDDQEFVKSIFEKAEKKILRCAHVLSLY